jgi:hypothetical protein
VPTPRDGGTLVEVLIILEFSGTCDGFWKMSYTHKLNHNLYISDLVLPIPMYHLSENSATCTSVAITALVEKMMQISN